MAEVSEGTKTSGPTIIVDNGAHTIKIGFAFDLKPPEPEPKASESESKEQEEVEPAAVPVPPAEKSDTEMEQEQPKPAKPPETSHKTQNMCLLMPNCIAKAKSERRRPFIANQIDDCRDTSGLFFILPFQKGYMTAPHVQKTIWDHIFGPEGLNINFSESNLIITEPLFNFHSVQELTCEILFGDYGFNSVCRTTAAHLADYNYVTNNPNLEGESNVCTLIVDSGHSFTHIVPFINGQKVTNAIRRIDVGGKALTNHLKELISYRQIHVLDETYLMNQVKEDLCFVTTDFNEDMRVARLRYPENTVYREYVLPDYTTVKRGYTRAPAETGTRPQDGEQILKMNNERFTVPELLFNPSDVGIKQMGISDLIHEIIQTFPESVQPHFYKNIVLIGGNANFPGFRDRVYSEVRKLANEDEEVQVHVDENPTTYAWFGGNKLAHDADLVKYTVTRDQYLAKGMAAFAKVSDI